MGPEEYTEMLHENERLKQQLEICESRIVDQENIILELNGMKESLITDLQTLEHNTVVEKDTSARLQFLLDNEKQMASNIQVSNFYNYYIKLYILLYFCFLFVVS